MLILWKANNLNILKMEENMKQLADIISTTKEVLTTDEAARYLGVSKSCLYKWTMDRAIPHYKSPSGKMCYFNRKEIEAWMQSAQVKTKRELEHEAMRYCLLGKGGKR